MMRITAGSYGQEGKYLLKIEGCERSLNILDSGTWPKKFINGLGPDGKLDMTKKEKLWDGFSILKTKEAACLI